MMTGVQVFPGGRVLIQGVSLKALVVVAYNVGWWQLSGGDPWVGNDYYNVEAKPPENLQPALTDLRYSIWAIDDPRLRQMLQSLLIERFQLKIHQDTKTGDVYLLEKSGKPIKLQPARGRSTGEDAMMPSGYSGDIDFAGGRFVLFNTSMPQLAKFASNFFLHRPVLDRTGLAGYFDYRSQMSVAMSPAPPQEEFTNTLKDSFMNLLPEIGLKLERSTGPVETYVIDHAEPPSPN